MILVSECRSMHLLFCIRSVGRSVGSRIYLADYFLCIDMFKNRLKILKLNLIYYKKIYFFNITVGPVRQYKKEFYISIFLY